MKTQHLIFSMLMPLMSLGAMAEVAVIAHPSNAATLTADDIQRMFLGKTKSFPNGSEATPVSNKSDSVRTHFNQVLLGKNESQIKAYWSQLVFTGKGTPPKELENDNAVKQFVAGNPGAIGYIDASNVDATVKVIISQ